MIRWCMSVNTNSTHEMDPRNPSRTLDLLYEPEQSPTDYAQRDFIAEPEGGPGGPGVPSRTFEGITSHPFITGALVVTLVVSFAGIRFWNYLQSYESTDDAQVDAHISPISSRISGTITGVYVEDNQRVKPEQLLVQLDTHDYDVAVEQARAQLAKAGADANSARQQYVSAIAKIHQAEAHNYQAQRDQQRYSTLLRLRVVSQAEYDQYDATARVDDADVEADQADAASTQRTIASREAQVAAAHASVDQAILNLRLVTRRLS
jgi:membrane fusion protein (multidrug efflux system)